MNCKIYIEIVLHFLDVVFYYTINRKCCGTSYPIYALIINSFHKKYIHYLLKYTFY